MDYHGLITFREISGLCATPNMCKPIEVINNFGGSDKSPYHCFFSLSLESIEVGFLKCPELNSAPIMQSNSEKIYYIELKKLTGSN